MSIQVPPTGGTAADGLRPGSIFRGLLIHSVLGRGAMGTAYLASHPILQVPHVIKTFHGAADVTIFREAYLGARVSSPYIVPVLDAGVDSNVAFAVQQYVDGVDLSELLSYAQKASRTLPLSVVLRLLRDVARGLHALHQAGIVHCDIKPANLFLSASGAAMVGDFGIATDVRMQVARRGVSGTPLFMAPEQWNERPVDRRTDLYSLGATAHLMATGSPPFQGPSSVALCLLHVTEPYKPPVPRSPREAYFYAVIERLMRKDPAQRYPSGEALARELVRIEDPPLLVDLLGEDTAQIGTLRITLRVGDLATQQADVLVNAANTLMIMDVGVAAALRRAAGEALAQEAQAHAPTAMGDVIWTAPGRLKARYVAHAVAAMGGAICLGRSTLRTLLGADLRQARSVAFPALGTGVGRVPLAMAAKLMIEAIVTFAALQPQSVRSVDLVLFDEASRQAFREVLQSM